MAKTEEELAELRNRIEEIESMLSELSEEELQKVTGGGRAVFGGRKPEGTPSDSGALM